MKSNPTPSSPLKSLFVGALRLSDAAARQAYLKEACGDDFHLCREVEELLASRDGASSNPLDQAVEQLQPARTSSTGIDREIDVSSHPMIGPYKLLERLGEGGMGTVFMAQQKQPVRRRVALKLIKPGMDSQQVIARFEAERQALAMMDHSNIARIFDGGLTEQGRPYFVMELVRGLPIDEYCDEATLSLRDRLKLFIDVCHAVQHAHQKGIIHRDLKPSNILITLHDSVPIVKVIDFGIAKALDHDLTEQTLFTRFSELIGTPAYMSPEQAEMSGLDVDTRSDVYSLGVMLYRLLAGVTPFDENALKSVGIDEMRRIIREDEPLIPSRKVSTLDNELGSTISERRRTDARKLSLSMHGELDWIVMKALEKNRDRRYESANELAQDVERYLRDEPVLACPPTLAYRLRKVARRNRAALTCAALVFIALVLGTIVSLWQAQEADQARRVAEDNSFQLKQRSIQLQEQRDRARRSEAFSRQLVYAADVRLAAQAWESGDVRHFADLLERHKQPGSREDLRGFEWRYLSQLGSANVRTIAEGSEGICSVRYSPDGKFLAAGRVDGTIHVWSGELDRRLTILSGHVGLVRGLDFSPDGKRLVSIGYGGVVRIWDLETLRETRNIAAFEDVHGYRVRFAMHGQAVIAIAEKSPAKIWDVESGELIDTFGANGRGSWGLAVSPDGQSCVVRDDAGDFRVWDLAPRKHVAWMRFPLHNEIARCLRYSPDGKIIAAGTDERIVRLFEARTGKLIASFAGHDDEIWDIAIHPSGTTLASCDLGGVIRTWSLENNERAANTNEIEDWPPSFRGHEERVWSLDFSPDGKRLVSASRDGRVRAWSGRPKHRRDLKVDESVASRFLASGDELIIAKRYTLAIWSRQTNEARPFGQSFQASALTLAVSPDSKIIATGHTDGIVRVWNTKTEQIDSLLTGHESDVEQIAFSPDGTLLVTASSDGTGKLWDVAAGKPLHVVEAPPHCVSAAFSPDGQTFAISSENNAMIFDAASGKRLHLLRGHQHTVKRIAFSPNGRWLATGSEDRTIRIWDVRTGKTRNVIASHQAQIYSLAFSPDGRTVASGDELGTIAFSHVETGRFLFDRQVASGEISCLHFSPNGKTLAATNHRKQVILLHAPGLSTFDHEARANVLMDDAEGRRMSGRGTGSSAGTSD